MKVAETLKALVVGTGFGCRIHVPALRAAGFDVVGVVGTDPQRTAARAEACGVDAAYVDLAEAIAQTGAQAVTIASPPHTHAELALTAIEHGCHLICEKPMANSLQEAETMLAAAQRAGVTHLIGHQFRWSPERATVTRALADRMVGEPRFLTLVSYLPLLADPEKQMPDWWFDEQAGGGWLGAHGSHLVDQVRSWLGEFDSVSAMLPMVSDRSGVAEDSYVLRFRLVNGVEGVMQQTAGAWGAPAEMVRVAGTRGTLWIDRGAVGFADASGERELAVPAQLQLPTTSAADNTHMNPGPYIRLCEVLRAGIEGREPPATVPAPTFEDGVAGMKVLAAIRQSAASNGELVRV